MNIYKVSQSENIVGTACKFFYCYAESDIEAKKMNHKGFTYKNGDLNWDEKWCTHPTFSEAETVALNIEEFEKKNNFDLSKIKGSILYREFGFRSKQRQMAG